MPVVSFREAGRNHRRRIQTRGIRKITKILWFLVSRPTELARVGGKIRLIAGQVEVEGVGQGFRGWDRQEGGSPRWIRMDLEGTLAVTVDQVVTRTLSLGLEVWVRVAEAEADTRVVEADVMVGLEVGAGMEVPGEMTIVIVITLGEVTTAEGEEAIIEAVGVATVNVGELGVAEAVVVEAVVAGDTKLPLVHTFLIITQLYSFSHFAHIVSSFNETRTVKLRLVRNVSLSPIKP